MRAIRALPSSRYRVVAVFFFVKSYGLIKSNYGLIKLLKR